MIIGGLVKTTLIDYPGHVAATIFTYGCSFKCGFCHNPDLVTGDMRHINIFKEQEIMDFLKKRQGLLDGVCITGGEPTLQKDLPIFCSQVKALGYKIKLD